MKENVKYYMVRQKAIPEVLLKVVEAKGLLESEKVETIQDAVDAVGISRSSFYKYKDDIFELHDNARGTTITLTMQVEDRPGLLSDVLKIIADFRGNILTIHQSIPINGGRVPERQYTDLTDHRGRGPDDSGTGESEGRAPCEDPGEGIRCAGPKTKGLLRRQNVRKI